MDERKAFNEWWRNQPQWITTLDEIDIAEAGWQAALKWAKTGRWNGETWKKPKTKKKKKKKSQSYLNQYEPEWGSC